MVGQLAREGSESVLPIFVPGALSDEQKLLNGLRYLGGAYTSCVSSMGAIGENWGSPEPWPTAPTE